MKKENSKIILWSVIALIVGVVIGLLITNVTTKGQANSQIIKPLTVDIKPDLIINGQIRLSGENSNWQEISPAELEKIHNTEMGDDEIIEITVDEDGKIISIEIIPVKKVIAIIVIVVNKDGSTKKITMYT
jgi:uncharacterized protein YuzE